MSEADYVVLRHGLDVPREYWPEELEGRWYDRAEMRPTFGVGLARAEPAGRFESREDGAVAEVWEIRLTTPNERNSAVPPCSKEHR